VILAGTVLYSHQSGSLAALGVNLEELVGVSWKNPPQTQPTKDLLRKKTPIEERVYESYPQAPLLQEPKLSTSDVDLAHMGDARAESSMISDVAEAKSEIELTGRASDHPGTAKTRPQTETFFYYSNDGAAGVEKLEFEIYKAIHNRAIRGVEVSVRDGAVYLTGQVATEKQKLAAAQAARSVPGVKDVRDQIAVNSFYYRWSRSQTQDSALDQDEHRKALH
ncbi:MAG TPA: BON domain-containing protein, partial [Candidatus Binatia bacterium]|nr:BON domain-containing protein [Candidatus Binatia bacterium]